MNEKLPVPQPDQQIQAFYEDEISLRDILLVVIKYKKVILATTVACTLLALIVSLIQEPVFEAKASFLPPSQEEIAPLRLIESSLRDAYSNSSNSALSNINRAWLYNQFQVQLQSETIKKKVFEEMEISKEFPDKDSNLLFEEYFKSYTLEKPGKKGEEEDRDSSILALTLNGSNPERLADVLNRVASYANNKVTKGVISELKAVKEAKISLLKEEISGLKIYFSNTLNDKIVQLTEQDKLSVNKVTEKIKALRNKDKLVKQDRIIVLEEAASVANKIGLIEPFSLKNDSMRIELLDQPKPLYYRGEKALRAQIEALKNRQSEDPFISGLRGLQEKLELLKENEKINILLERKNNDPFIIDLRKKELALSKVKALNVDVIKDINAVTIDKLATPPSKKIKPKRSIIVVMGLLLGLLLGLILAFFNNYIHEHPLNEE